MFDKNMTRRFARRSFLAGLGAAAALPILAACQPQVIEKTVEVPVVVKETVVVQEVVEKEVVIEKPVEVEKEVIVAVEKEVTRVVEAMAKPRVKLTYWYAADSPELLKVFQEQLLVFQTAHPEIELSPELIANLADLRSKIVSTKSAGVGPDVTYGNNGMPQDYYVAGWLQHLQNYYDEWSRKGDIPDSLINLGRIKPDQPLLMMPYAAFTDNHHYRTDHFADAGLEPPDTFDEMYATAKELTDSDNDKYGIGFRAGDNGGFRMAIWNMWKAYGVDGVQPDGTVDLDSDVAVEVIANHAQAVHDGLTQPSLFQDRFPQMVAMLQSGKIAQWQGQSVHAPLLVTGRDDPEVHAMTPPPKGPVRRASVMGAQGNLMFKGDVQDESWAFIEHMTDDPMVEGDSRTHGFIPGTKSVAEMPYFRDNRFTKVGIETIEFGFSPPFWHKHWGTAFDAVANPTWHEVLQKKITPKEMQDILAKELRKP